MSIVERAAELGKKNKKLPLAVMTHMHALKQQKKKSNGRRGVDFHWFIGLLHLCWLTLWAVSKQRRRAGAGCGWGWYEEHNPLHSLRLSRLPEPQRTHTTSPGHRNLSQTGSGCDSPASCLCSCGAWSPACRLLWLRCVCGSSCLGLCGKVNQINK